MSRILAIIVSLFVFMSFSHADYIENVMSDEEIASKINEMSSKLEETKNKKEKAALYEEFGEMFFSKGAYDAAADIYAALLELKLSKKKKAQYYIRLGDIEAAKKSYNKSLEYYKDALALYKKNNDIKKRIGDILMESNLYGLAEQNFKDILENDKNSDYAKKRLGDIYSRRQRYEKALEYYEDINRSYYDKELISAMAACYKSLNKLDKAVRLVNNFINDDPSSDMYLLSGLLYSDMEKMKEAEQQYLAAIRFDDENFSAYIHLASIYLDGGDLQKAEDMLNKAYSINSYTSAVDIMYAAMSYKNGRLYNARRYAANAVIKSKTPFLKQQSQRILDFLNKQ